MGVKSCALAWELSTIFNIESAPGPPPPPPPHPAPSPPSPRGSSRGPLWNSSGSSLGSGSVAEGTRFAILSHNFEAIFLRPSQPVSEGSWRVPGGVKCLAKIEIFANGCQKLRTGMAMLKLDV